MILAMLAGVGLGFGVARIFPEAPAPVAAPIEFAIPEELPAIDASPIVRIASPDTKEEASKDAPKSGGAPPKSQRAARKVSLPDVIKELEKLRQLPASRQTKQRESDLIDQWIELDPAGAAAWAANIFANGGDEQLLRKAVGAYARRDARAAAAWASTLVSPIVRDSAMREIFETWSAADPRSAALMVTFLPIGSAQSTAAAVIGKHFARLDFQGALAWMGTLASPAQSAAFQAIMRTQWAMTGTSNPGAALPWLLAQSSLSFREQGLRFIASEWSKRDPLAALAQAGAIMNPPDRKVFFEAALGTYTQTNPRQAALWLASQPPSPEIERLMNGVMAAWTAFQPWQAAQWVTALENPALQVKSITAVAESWARVNPDGLVDWLGKLQDVPLRDAAVEGATRVWMRNDPATAAQWAAGIVDLGKRDQTVTQIVREWKNQDMAAALAFVQSTPAIDETLRQRLLR